MKLQFEFLNETPGALRYVEIDAENGHPVIDDAAGAHIGNLYFRKRMFGFVSGDYASEGKAPKRLTITVEAHDE
jgi:hypothetical protein